MELPLFPLHLVLFPGRPLPLHLFEPRYRQMLGDCLDADRRFGVVAIREGFEVGTTPEIYQVGTIAEIESVTELDDGRFDILTRGVQRFRVREQVGGSAYAKARVEPLPDGPATDFDQPNAKALRALLVPYLAGLGAPAELLEHLPHGPAQLAYLAAAAVQGELREQQELLELESTSLRLRATLDVLRRETSIMRRFGTVASLRPLDPRGADLN
ncbi:LON peptidase substrate-binding domain-containing protein [soil metagenome]